MDQSQSLSREFKLAAVEEIVEQEEEKGSGANQEETKVSEVISGLGRARGELAVFHVADASTSSQILVESSVPLTHPRSRHLLIRWPTLRDTSIRRDRVVGAVR